jgi:hypothetical protein
MELKLSEARQLIKSAKGRIFSATFVKKNGEVRRMSARTGVKRYVTGTGMKYKPSDYDLVTVFDMQKKLYRSINIGSLMSLTVNGTRYEVN